MSEFLIPLRLFDNALVSGLATGVQSSAIRLDRDVLRMESITFLASSVVSTPDLGFFYAISKDNVLFGSFADNAALLTSTVSLLNPQGFQALAMPTALAPYVKFLVSGTGSNPLDSRVTSDLWLRMG